VSGTARRVRYSVLVSLDGFCAGPEGELDWHPVDEELHRFFNEFDRQADTHLYGRRTYEVMAAFWPRAEDDPDLPDYVREYARIWKGLERIVASRTLQEAPWATRILRDGVGQELARLKSLPGKDIAVGGPALVSQLLPLGLVDEVRVSLAPILLGRGRPLSMAGAGAVGLRLVDTRRFGSGVVHLRYETVPPPAGD